MVPIPTIDPVLDLTDDSRKVFQMIGLKKFASLQSRLIARLGKLLEASSVKAEKQNGELHLYIALHDNSARQRIDKLIQAIREVAVTANDSGHSVEMASGNAEQHSIPVSASSTLWRVLRNYASKNTSVTAASAKVVIEDNKNEFDQLVSRLVGLDELEGPFGKAEEELATRIIELIQALTAYDETAAKTDILINVAARMAQDCAHLDQALRSLLRKSAFAKKLYTTILHLGFPKRAHGTLVRSAETYPEFRTLKYHVFATSYQKGVSFVPPTIQSKLIYQVEQQRTSSLGKAFNSLKTSPAPNLGSRADPPPLRPDSLPQHLRGRKTSPGVGGKQPITANSEDVLLSIVRPYLPEDDRDTPLPRLCPKSKQDTAEMAAFVLRGVPPPAPSSAWYEFGFVALNSIQQEFELAQLYRSYLTSSTSHQEQFVRLQDALASDNLVSALKDMIKHILIFGSSLSKFFKTLPQDRETVWILKQFILTGETVEPLLWLQRDYGFKLCRGRDEVRRLKSYYAEMLDKIGPTQVHDACVHGRLLIVAQKSGVKILPGDKRFLQAERPASYIGFMNKKGLPKHLGSFFRKG